MLCNGSQEKQQADLSPIPSHFRLLAATPERVHPRRNPPRRAEDQGGRAARAACADSQELHGQSHPILWAGPPKEGRAELTALSPRRLCPTQDHRHAFVRKNAVFTVYSIYKLHEHLIPDAPELLLTFLAAVRSPAALSHAPDPSLTHPSELPLPFHRSRTLPASETLSSRSATLPSRELSSTCCRSTTLSPPWTSCSNWPSSTSSDARPAPRDPTEPSGSEPSLSFSTRPRTRSSTRPPPRSPRSPRTRPPSRPLLAALSSCACASRTTTSR